MQKESVTQLMSATDLGEASPGCPSFDRHRVLELSRKAGDETGVSSKG